MIEDSRNPYKKLVKGSKRKQKNRKQHKDTDNSISKSMLSDVEKMLGLSDLFGGKLVHSSYDCPENLRKTFVAECKANRTSACKVRQSYDAFYVTISRLKKHALGDTLSKVFPVAQNIGDLKFTQYVQSRPRRLMRHVEPVEVSEDGGVACGFRDCSEKAVGRAVWLDREEEYLLCEVHLAEAKANRRQWRVLD